MKKIILVFIMLIFSSNVYASHIVMDMDTLRVLSGTNEHEEKLIASTTKIMTSIVVINNVKNLDEVITVNESVLRSHGSNIYIEVGEKISVKDLLYGLMLRSGNDAAIILAEYVGGSEEGFATLMNEEALAIGMKNTYFINASGLEDNFGNGNTSTCYDLALLMSYAMKNKTFREIVGTKEKTVKTNNKVYSWTNKNKLLFNYKYTTGGKTGYTKKAKRTLVTSASEDDKNITIVTLNESDDFNLHETLYKNHFKNYHRYKVLDKDYFLKDKNQYIKNDIYMLLTEEEYKNIKIDINYVKDSLKRIGYVTVSLDNSIYIKEDIYEESEKKISFIDKIINFIRNLFK